MNNPACSSQIYNIQGVSELYKNVQIYTCDLPLELSIYFYRFKSEAHFNEFRCNNPNIMCIGTDEQSRYIYVLGFLDPSFNHCRNNALKNILDNGYKVYEDGRLFFTKSTIELSNNFIYDFPLNDNDKECLKEQINKKLISFRSLYGIINPCLCDDTIKEMNVYLRPNPNGDKCSFTFNYSIFFQNDELLKHNNEFS